MLEENYSYRFEYYILKSDGTNITESIQLRLILAFFHPKCIELEWDMKMWNKNPIQFERKGREEEKKNINYSLMDAWLHAIEMAVKLE